MYYNPHEISLGRGHRADSLRRGENGLFFGGEDFGGRREVFDGSLFGFEKVFVRRGFPGDITGVLFGGYGERTEVRG